MNSYLDNQRAIDRLTREWHQHHNLIVGFDFDCTIFDYHNEGLETKEVVDLLLLCSKLGFTMCLYTLTPKDSEMSMVDKLNMCFELGINVSYCNDSPVLKTEDQDSRYDPKPYFNILLDDRAGLASAYYILKQTLIDLDLYESTVSH